MAAIPTTNVIPAESKAGEAQRENDERE